MCTYVCVCAHVCVFARVCARVCTCASHVYTPRARVCVCMHVWVCACPVTDAAWGWAFPSRCRRTEAEGRLLTFYTGLCWGRPPVKWDGCPPSPWLSLAVHPKNYTHHKQKPSCLTAPLPEPTWSFYPPGRWRLKGRPQAQGRPPSPPVLGNTEPPPTSQLRRPPPQDPQAPTGPQDSTRKAWLQETVVPPSGHQGAPGLRSRTKRCREQEERTGPAAALGGHPASFTPRGAGTPLGAWPCGALRGRGAATGPPGAGAEESQGVQGERPREEAPGAAAGTTPPQLQSPPSHAQQRALPVLGPSACTLQSKEAWPPTRLAFPSLPTTLPAPLAVAQTSATLCLGLTGTERPVGAIESRTAPRT